MLFAFAWRSVCQYSMAEENPAAQRQTAVTACFTSKRLLLFAFAWRSVCQYSMPEENPAAQTQTAVTACFTSKRLLLFAFAWRSVCQYSMAEENPAAQTQTAVAAYLKSKQLLLFVHQDFSPIPMALTALVQLILWRNATSNRPGWGPLTGSCALSRRSVFKRPETAH